MLHAAPTGRCNELLPGQFTRHPADADALPAVVPLFVRPFQLVLVPGVPVHPGGDPLPPVGPAPFLRVLVVALAVGRYLDLDYVVRVQAEVGEHLGGAADVAFVVGPPRLVLVAADRDVAEDDVAVLAQPHHTHEVVQIEWDGGSGGDLREVRAGEPGADLGHARIVTAGSDNTDSAPAHVHGSPYGRPDTGKPTLQALWPTRLIRCCV